MNRISALLVAAVLLAVAAAGYLLWQREYSATAKALKVLKFALVDPDSAKFEDVQHFSDTGATCGNVNAKNRMGGYTGFTYFIVTKAGDVLFDPRANTKSGTEEQRLVAIDKQIAFLEKAQAECPEPGGPSAPAPK